MILGNIFDFIFEDLHSGIPPAVWRYKSNRELANWFVQFAMACRGANKDYGNEKGNYPS